MIHTVAEYNVRHELHTHFLSAPSSLLSLLYYYWSSVPADARNKLNVHLRMLTNIQTRNVCLRERITSLFIHHKSKGRGTSKTHIELQFICPLSDQAVTRAAGVCGLVLEDVVTPRGVPILVKHDWGACAAW